MKSLYFGYLLLVIGRILADGGEGWEDFGNVSEECAEEMAKYTSCLSQFNMNLSEDDQGNNLTMDSQETIQNYCSLMESKDCLTDIANTKSVCLTSEKFADLWNALFLLMYKIPYFMYCSKGEDGAICPLSAYLQEHAAELSTNNGIIQKTPELLQALTNDCKDSKCHERMASINQLITLQTISNNRRRRRHFKDKKDDQESENYSNFHINGLFDDQGYYQFYMEEGRCDAILNTPITLPDYSPTGSCDITVEDGECQVPESCTSKDKGYHFVNSMYLVSYDGEDQCTVINNPTPGFYIDKKSSSEGWDTVIHCYADNRNCVMMDPSESPCDEENDGILIKTDTGSIGLCTKINQLNHVTTTDSYSVTPVYTVIPFLKEEKEEEEEEEATSPLKKQYIVHHTKNSNNVFNIDSYSKDAYYVVSVSTDAIILDVSVTEEDLCADTSGELVDRRSDFCSDRSSGMYYTCIRGKCSAEEQYNPGTFEMFAQGDCSCQGGSTEYCEEGFGYFLDGTDLYHYTDQCEKQTKPSPGYYWNRNRYNQVVMCDDTKSQTCSPVVEFVSECHEDNKYQFIDTGYNIMFCDDSANPVLLSDLPFEGPAFVQGRPETPFPNPNYYYRMTSNGVSFNVDTSYSNDIEIINDEYYTCVNGICSKGKVCVPSDPQTLDNCTEEGYYLEKSILYKCTLSDGKMECVSKNGSLGYFRAANGKDVIQCGYDDQGNHRCDKVYILDAEDAPCEEGAILPTSSLKLCIDSTNDHAIELFKKETTSKEYIPYNFLYADYLGSKGKYYAISIGETESIPTANKKDEILFNTVYKTIIKCVKSEMLCTGTQEVGYYFTSDSKMVECIAVPSDCTFDDPDECTPEPNQCEIVDTALDGYYINKASESTKELISCTSSTPDGVTTNSCTLDTQQDKRGYYLAGTDPFNIIYCDEDHCEKIKATRKGFFYNTSYNSYVICASDAVDGITCKRGEDTTCSVANQYGVVVKRTSSSSSNLVFCQGTTTEVGLSSSTTPTYYVVSGITSDGSINYPASFIGTQEEKIVIRVDPYSTVQYEDNTGAICIDNNGKLKNPCGQGDTQYVCPSALNKCESKVIGACDPTTNGQENWGNCLGYYYVGSTSTLYSCQRTYDSETGVSSPSCEPLNNKVGYFVNSDPDSPLKYVKCTTDGAATNPSYRCIGLNDPNNGGTCTSTTVGSLIKSKGTIKLCLDESNDHAIELFKEDVTTTAYLPEKFLKTSITSNTLYQVVEVTSKDVLPKTLGADDGGNYLFNGQIMKCSGNSDECTKTILNGYYISKDEPQKLIVCSNGICESKSAEYGYYVNAITDIATAKYIKCTSHGCIALGEPDVTSCSSFEDGIEPKGNLIKEVDFEGKFKAIKLCIDYDDENAISVFNGDNNNGSDSTTPTENYYIQANAFDAMAQANKYYLLSIGEKAVVPQKINNSGNYLSPNKKVMVCVKDAIECEMVSQEGYYLSQEDENQTIRCNENNECEMETSLGYFKKAIPDSKPYIRCKDGKCEDIGSNTSCTNFGNLMKDGGSIKLCTDDTSTNAIEIFKRTNDQYFIQAKIFNSSITSDKKFYIVKMDPYSAQKIETSNNNYGVFKYTYPEATQQKILRNDMNGKFDGECPEDVTKLKEYRRNDDDSDTYTVEE